MPNPSQHQGTFAYVGRKFAVLATILWALGIYLASESPVGDFVTTRLARPIEFKTRDLLGKTPHLSETIKIFSLDDSTYAKLRRPNLSGAMWAELFAGIARSKPKAILTNHMFGTGEFDDGGGELAETLQRLRKGKLYVTAGSFAYPGKIQYRTPLSLDREEFHTYLAHGDGEDPRPPFVDRMGWSLYGPDQEFARLFSRLGHLSYDGKGRIPAVLRLAPDRVIPHLSFNATDQTQYSALGIRLGDELIPVTDDGLLWVNLLPMEAYTKRAKSLKALFRDLQEGGKSQHVNEGDTVLILTDMYTGNVSFVPTPLGSMPGGYIVAAMLNSVQTGSWVRELGGLPLFIAVAAVTGAALGVLAQTWVFWSLFFLSLMSLVAASLSAFSWGQLFFPWIPMGTSFAGCALTVYGRRMQGQLREEASRSRQAERETAKLNAIVRTAQMFAHDVRKPFSMLNMALQSIQREGDPKRTAEIFDRLFPELKRAMGSVEGMIQDIMEIDSNAELDAKPCTVMDLVKVSLYEVFALRKDAEVHLQYRFRHTMQINVDFNRVRRVMVNIIDNAIQAMDGRGTIWLQTRDLVQDEKSFVEIVIGNDNSVIPADVLPKIFEAFYTKGKKAGTGLGLAIAHKVVTDHGGEITCSSSNAEGTQFRFSLPVAHVTPQDQLDPAHLPEEGREFASPRWAEALKGLDDDAHDPKEEKRLETRLSSMALSRGRPIDILLIDDERIYLDSLAAQLKVTGSDSTVSLRQASSADEALAAVAAMEPDVIYCDIDLGPNSIDGFELVEALRARRVKSAILVHSNRVMPRDARRASEAGADHFLPKPAGRVQLLKVLVSVMEDPEGAHALHPEGDRDPRHPEGALATEGPRGPKIVVIDDSPFTREAWAAHVSDGHVLAFPSPEAFFDALESSPRLLDDVACVVVDFYFEGDSATGADVARKIRARSDVPLCLCTDGAPLSTEERAAFDAVIPKEPQSVAELQKRLRSGGAA